MFITDATSAPEGPVAPTGVTAVKAGNAYSVNYTGATVPTVDQALAAIQAAIVADGYTIKGISYAAPTYTISVTKTVAGFEVAQPDFTFNDLTGIVRLYAVAAVNAAAVNGVSATVTANKATAAVGDTVIVTVTLSGATSSVGAPVTVVGSGVVVTANSYDEVTAAAGTTITAATGASVADDTATVDGTFTFTYTMTATSVAPTVTIA